MFNPNHRRASLIKTCFNIILCPISPLVRRVATRVYQKNLQKSPPPPTLTPIYHDKVGGEGGVGGGGITVTPNSRANIGIIPKII